MQPALSRSDTRRAQASAVASACPAGRHRLPQPPIRPARNVGVRAAPASAAPGRHSVGKPPRPGFLAPYPPHRPLSAQPMRVGERIGARSHRILTSASAASGLFGCATPVRNVSFAERTISVSPGTEGHPSRFVCPPRTDLTRPIGRQRRTPRQAPAEATCVGPEARGRGFPPGLCPGTVDKSNPLVRYVTKLSDPNAPAASSHRRLTSRLVSQASRGVCPPPPSGDDAPAETLRSG